MAMCWPEIILSASTSEDWPGSTCVASRRPTTRDPEKLAMRSRPCGTFALLSPTINNSGTLTASSEASVLGTKVVLSFGVIKLTPEP